MVVEDTWRLKDGRTPSARDGRGLRWRVRVQGQSAKSFRTKPEAERWNAKLITNPPKPESTVTVGELVDLWLAGKKGLSPKGLVSAKGDARHVRASWGDRTAVSIQTHEIQSWVADMTAVVGKGDNRVVRPASTAMRDRTLQCLRGSLQIAVETEALARNTATGVSIPRGNRREPKFLTADELVCLAYSCDGWGNQSATWLPAFWAPLVMILGTTGVRVGEASALRVGDVNRRRARLRVKKAKSGRGRDVPIPKTVLSLLNLNRGSSESLFVGPDGGGFDQNTWRQRAFARAVDMCGFGGLRVHDLRHTAISLAIAAGARIVDVQAMAGHSRPSTTLDVYGHLLHDGLDDVAARVDKMF